MLNLGEEEGLWAAGYKMVAGVDEAGRGPLAGPVVAAAVLVGKKSKENKKLKVLQEKVRDSKKLSSLQREEIFRAISDCPGIKWAAASVSEKIIDKINIKNAAELAMEKTVKKLGRPPDFLIIDGNALKNKWLKKIKHKLVVGGDGKVFSCAAASIMAKVTRDRMMKKYHKKYPHFGFDKNKGYPTKFHYEALKEKGPCKIHRKSFRLDFSRGY